MKQWDDWVPQDRVRKFTEENKELAAQLHSQMKALQQKAPKSATKRGGRANGSDFSSARGSEERHVAAQGGRGPRRNRDYDLEPVSTCIVFSFLTLFFLCSLHCVMPSPGRACWTAARRHHIPHHAVTLDTWHLFVRPFDPPARNLPPGINIGLASFLGEPQTQDATQPPLHKR